jgi:hypothetical protein
MSFGRFAGIEHYGYVTGVLVTEYVVKRSGKAIDCRGIQTFRIDHLILAKGKIGSVDQGVGIKQPKGFLIF